MNRQKSDAAIKPQKKALLKMSVFLGCTQKETMSMIMVMIATVFLFMYVWLHVKTVCGSGNSIVGRHTQTFFSLPTPLRLSKCVSSVPLRFLYRKRKKQKQRLPRPLCLIGMRSQWGQMRHCGCTDRRLVLCCCGGDVYRCRVVFEVDGYVALAACACWG